MLSIKKKDKVIVLSGKNKDKTGEVIEILKDKKRVLISKVNFVKRHKKATQTEPAGIHEKEAPLSICSVMLICPKCQNPTRPKFDFLSDGKKIRVCRRCNEMIV